MSDKHEFIKDAAEQHYEQEIISLKNYNNLYPSNRNEACYKLAPEGERVLEIGCGGGNLLFNLRKKYNELHGIELAANRAIAVRNALASKDVKAEIIQASLENGLTKYNDGYFDTIVWSDVIEHVVDLYGAMSEIRRLLKDKGTLVTSTPNIATLRRRTMLLMGVFPSTSASDEGLGIEGGNIFDGGHVHYFTLSNLKKLYHKFNILPGNFIACGKFYYIRTLNPSLLSGSINLVGYKQM